MTNSRFSSRVLGLSCQECLAVYARHGCSCTKQTLSSIRQTLVTPWCKSHYCTLGDILLCWSLCYVGYITGCGYWLHSSLGTLHITFFPLVFPGHFQSNSSKSSVISNTVLLFKFWEVTKGNGNSLYCFGSLLSSLDQLEGKSIMPSTEFFFFKLVFQLLEEALPSHVTKPSLELHICTLSKLMCFLIAFPDLFSVTSFSFLCF